MKPNTQLPDKDVFLTSISTLEDFTNGVDHLLKALETHRGTRIAKMVVAGRLIERGWIIATRDNLQLRPIETEHRPGLRKTLQIQIDRNLWADWKQKSLTGMTARDRANMYLSIGLLWPAVDIGLDLSTKGYGPKIQVMLALAS